MPEKSKSEDLRSLLTSISSENRIQRIEEDLKNVRERITRLEEQQRQRNTREESRFRLKLALIGVLGSILSAVVTYVLTKIGILP